MKHLLILLCASALVSCSIKNKLLNSTSDSLGVPKQLSEQNSVTKITTATTISQLPTLQSQPVIVNELVNEPNLNKFKWYYTIPFIGLVILAVLVYKLKRQNLKSL